MKNKQNSRQQEMMNHKNIMIMNNIANKLWDLHKIIQKIYSKINIYNSYNENKFFVRPL